MGGDRRGAAALFQLRYLRHPKVGRESSNSFTSRPCSSLRNDSLLAFVPLLRLVDNAVRMVDSSASTWLAWLAKGDRDSLSQVIRATIGWLQGCAHLSCSSSTCAGQGFWGGGESQVWTGYDYSAGTNDEKQP